jgi:hypothetical protein
MQRRCLHASTAERNCTCMQRRCLHASAAERNCTCMQQLHVYAATARIASAPRVCMQQHTCTARVCSSMQGPARMQGETHMDEHMLTGESAPVEKLPGAQVVGGTLNVGASVVMRATHVGSDTVLQAITRLVANAQLAKAPVQSFADAVSAVRPSCMHAVHAWLLHWPTRVPRCRCLCQLWSRSRWRQRCCGG